jgi:hypothetical protein
MSHLNRNLCGRDTSGSSKSSEIWANGSHYSARNRATEVLLNQNDIDRAFGFTSTLIEFNMNELEGLDCEVSLQKLAQSI